MTNKATLEANETAAPASAHRKLQTPEAAKNFMLAGKAIFTLVSQRTGTRYTFKVRHTDSEQYGESWMVSYLTGQDNEGDYTYIGQIKERKGVLSFATTKGSKLTMASAPVAGFNWAFNRINVGQDTPNMEVWHAGRCGRCGRLLTVPSSIEMGLGPECASKDGF